MISAVIITLNEEHNISRCIQSLDGVADEVIVVDSYSQDRTVEICEKMGAKVFCTQWRGYAETKNFANSLATHNYILSIDADEALSDQLRQSILSVKDNLSGAYSFNRLTNYCGKWIRHGGWYPDVKVRLFPKHTARWEGLYVHEKLIFLEPTNIQHLHGDLLHYSIVSVADHLKRIEHYSTLQAKQMFESGQKFSYVKMYISPFVRFLKQYILQLGILDGKAGLQIAYYSALAVYKKYFKHLQIVKKGYI